MNEQKIQNWRAIAVSNDNMQHLIYVAYSYEQLKKQYTAAFYDVLTDDEQISIKDIKLERWQGLPDKGRWVVQDLLKIPEMYKKPTTIQ